MSFKILNQDTDVVTQASIVTSGVFQDGASKITTFFTSTVQSGSTGDYSLDVFRYNPANNASASVQFGIAYGHYEGSGSLGGVGVVGERPTAAVYSQFNNLINPPQTQKFKFGAVEADDIFVLSFNRARVRQDLEPGGWEIHLSASAGTATKIKLIDDSSTADPKVGESGKIFGSVTNIQLADALSNEGFKIERKNINLLTNNIKSVGKYEAEIKLHKEVSGKINFEVVEG